MPSYRIGFGSDFTLKNQKLGVGTDTASAELDIRGTTSFNDTNLGISTFSSYSGFSAQEYTNTDLVLGSDEYSTTGDIVVGIGSTFIVSVGATVTVGTVESVSIGTHFSPPTGGIEDRPEVPVEGTVRFNRDLNTLEFYNGVDWRQFIVNGARGRGLYCGGTTTGSDQVKTIDYIEIATQGNAIDFGELSVAREGCGRGTISSTIRGISMAGWTGSASDVIDYLTIASSGNAVDFGNSSQARGWGAGMSSSTRGLNAGGYSPSTVDTIDYVEIATTGNALDFGNLPTVKESTVGMASPTRGIVGTGMSPSWTSEIDYLTIASKGDAIVFGDLGEIRGLAAAANQTRGLFTGGKGPNVQNLTDIYKITIASTGSITEFGNIGIGARKPEGVSNCIRACFAGGNREPGGRITRIRSVNFSSDGITEFFGDLTKAREAGNSNSDSHGGLGGY